LRVLQAERDNAKKAQDEYQIRSAILNVQQIRTGTHEALWRDKGLAIVRESLSLRRDESLMDEGAACLTGIDFSRITPRTDPSGSAVRFDSEGKRLLFSGLTVRNQGERRGRLVDLITGEVRLSSLSGAGVLAFRREDRKPLQFGFGVNDGLVLWDM